MKYDGADTLSICPELARWKQNVKGDFFFVSWLLYSLWNWGWGYPLRVIRKEMRWKAWGEW